MAIMETMAFCASSSSDAKASMAGSANSSSPVSASMPARASGSNASCRLLTEDAMRLSKVSSMVEARSSDAPSTLP